MTAPQVQAGRSGGLEAPAADLAAVRDFLAPWFGDGRDRVAITAIKPRQKGKPSVKERVFEWPADRQDMLDWVKTLNDLGFSIYWQPNVGRPGLLGHASKANLAQLVTAHADVDPDKSKPFDAERKRLGWLAEDLADGSNPPTFIVDSGGGLNIYWRTSEPCDALPEWVDEVEGFNDRLGDALGGPGCQDASRILRLPGTVNLGNFGTKAGRPPTLAKVLHATGAIYTWREIAAIATEYEDEPPLNVEIVEPVEAPVKPPGHGLFAGANAGWWDNVDDQDAELKKMLDAILTTHRPMHYNSDETWLALAMAVHNASEGCAFDLFDAFSHELDQAALRAGQNASSYNADENRKRWDSFRDDKPKLSTIGSLIYHAKANGYRPQLWGGLAEQLRATVADIAAKEPPANANGSAGPATTAPEPEPEPEPQPTAAPNWTKPPADVMFHGPLGEMVLKLDPMTEASAGGTLACLLTMYGNALGRNFYIPVGASRHFPNLYTWLVGPSAEGRKGTAADNALMMMRALMPDWCENNIRRALNSGQGIIKVVRDLDDEARNQTGGSGVGDKRVMFLVAELGDTLAKAKADGNTILPTLRDFWDTGAGENTSVTRSMRVKGASVSWLGMITPEDLADQLELKELVTGSLNRVLMINVKRSKVLPGMPPVLDPSMVAPIAERIKENLKTLRSRTLFGNAGIEIPITLSPDAEAMAVVIKHEKEKGTRTWLDSGSARAFVQILRVALVYAVADGSKNVEPVHLQAAKAFVGHAERSIKKLASGGIKDPLAERILKHMREDPKEVLSRTEISSDVFNGHVSAAPLEEAIRVLLRLGMLAEETVPTKGRSRTVYRLV
jgi:Primase C terminal 2 (PriCT-2)